MSEEAIYQEVRTAEEMCRLLLFSVASKPLTDVEAMELGDIFSRVAAAEILNRGLIELAAAVRETRFLGEHAHRDDKQGELW